MSVGVCSQDEALREKFTGTPEKVVNLFKFAATEMRDSCFSWIQFNQ